MARGELARAGTVALVVLFALLASGARGVPDELPGIALDWPLLFHVERAIAILAGVGAAVLVGWRAMHGEFPARFGQVEYAAKEAAEEAEIAVIHDRRLQTLEDWVGLRRAGEPRRGSRRDVEEDG